MEPYGMMLHKTVKYLPVLLPLIWLPLFIEYLVNPELLMLHDTIIFGFDLVYIFVVRFFILDLILYFITKNDRTARFALLEIVFLYLEVTFITVTYFGFMYDLFGVFRLFRFSGVDPALVASVTKHTLVLSMYISVQNFTTLGLGDWQPNVLSSIVSHPVV